MFCNKCCKTTELESKVTQLQERLNTEGMHLSAIGNALAKARHDAEWATKERDEARAKYKQFEHDKTFELEMLQSILKQLTININLRGK